MWIDRQMDKRQLQQLMHQVLSCYLLDILHVRKEAYIRTRVHNILMFSQLIPQTLRFTETTEYIDPKIYIPN